MKIFRHVVQHPYFKMQKEFLDSELRRSGSDVSKLDPEQDSHCLQTATRVQLRHEIRSTKRMPMMPKFYRYGDRNSSFPTRLKTSNSDFGCDRGGIAKWR